MKILFAFCEFWLKYEYITEMSYRVPRLYSSQYGHRIAHQEVYLLRENCHLVLHPCA